MNVTEAQKRGNAAYRERNREKLRLDSILYYQNNKQSCHERTSKNRQVNPENSRVIKRRGDMKKYGLTIELYEAMLLSQGGLCKLCKGTNPKKRLDVDHCHADGKVRDLVCNACNRKIEAEERYPELTYSVRLYLAEHHPELHWNEQSLCNK